MAAACRSAAYRGVANHWYDQSYTVIDKHADILKGFCWLLSEETDPEVARTLGALTCRRTARCGQGARLIKVGNAGVYALGQLRDATPWANWRC